MISYKITYVTNERPEKVQTLIVSKDDLISILCEILKVGILQEVVLF